MALDRPRDLEKNLRAWIRTDDAGNGWRVSLAYLLAEQGKIAEAIKLLESELRPRCHVIWVTTCPEEQQIQRLMNGRKMTRAHALARIRSQAPQAEKLAQADIVIDTSGTMDCTEKQVEQAWRSQLDLETR